MGARNRPEPRERTAPADYGNWTGEPDDPDDFYDPSEDRQIFRDRRRGTR